MLNAVEPLRDEKKICNRGECMMCPIYKAASSKICCEGEKTRKECVYWLKKVTRNLLYSIDAVNALLEENIR